jgi:ribose 5-phosphate isomerase RpiB
MGMSINANKFPNVFAAAVETVQAAAINNASVLTMGGNIWKECHTQLQYTPCAFCFKQIVMH